MSLENVSILGGILVVLCGYIKFRRWGSGRSRKTVAFFHPHAAGRGGGERVLWAAVDGMKRDPGIDRIIIYSINDRKKELLESRDSTFDFANPTDGDNKIVVTKVRWAFLMEPKSWPVCTVLGQSLGSVVVLLAILLTSPLNEWPDVYIDTIGCPFTLPVAKLVTGAKVHTYIHYPTMSNDILKNPSRGHNWLTTLLPGLKRVYYQFFLTLYKLCGSSVDVAVCNSNWTLNRVRDVWQRSDLAVLYPPAAIGEGEQISEISSEENGNRQDVIVSLAQFRPEKNHDLQLRVFAGVLEQCPSATFWVMGGVRNAGDAKLVERLKKLAFQELKIAESRVEFVINASREEVNERLGKAKCAIHTMKDEHFGISLLEFLHAKTPVVSHRSGGPEQDILMPDERFGFLATAKEEFVEKCVFILRNFDTEPVERIRVNAFNSLNRFYSDDVFGQKFAQLFS